MRLITVFELVTRSELELRVMFRTASEAVMKSDSAAKDRENALTSLTNISRAMRIRVARKP